MIDDVERVEICPRPLCEDPSVVDLEGRAGTVVSLSCALDYQETIVEEDLLHFTILHQ